MGFWTAVARSVRYLDELSRLCILYLFCFLLVHRPWSVFSLLIEILLPLFYTVSLSYPQVELGLGLLDFFVDHGLVPSLPRLCTARPGLHVTSWRTMHF